MGELGYVAGKHKWKKNRWHSLWNAPSSSSGQVTLCTLNNGAAERIWVWKPWDIVHNWEKVITKTAACYNVLKQGAGKPAHSHCD